MTRPCFAVLLACTLWPVTAAAQAPDLTRPDLSAAIGWLNASKNLPDSWSDWYNRSVQVALSFGYHWTPQLKSVAEASISSRGRVRSSEQIVVDGLPARVFVERTFHTRRLTVEQHYQFGSNQWFHPNLGAGVDVNWETTSRVDREGYFITSPGRPPLPPVRYPDRTDVHVRPLVTAGFKAYVGPRAFVRSDLRVVVGRRLHEVVLRVGFGADL
jgi:hypothetical protein